MKATEAQLKVTCDALEALTSVGGGNNNEHGWMRRIALALEEGSGTSSTSGSTLNGYLLRAALAAEAQWGGDGDAENDNYAGLLQRLVDAMELDAGVSAGSLGQRLATAAGLVAFTPAAPVNITPPAIIEETLAVGDSPTWTNGTWTGSPSSYAAELYADDVLIGGGPYASGAFELTASEEGANIKVGVVATNGVGDSDEEFSAAVGPVEAAPSAFAITTPVLSDIGSAPGDFTPSYNIDFVDEYPTGGGIGDVLLGRWGTSEAAAEALTPVEATVDEGWWIDGDDPFPDYTTFCEAQSPGTAVYFQVRVVRGPATSNWSAFWTFVPGYNPLTKLVVEGDSITSNSLSYAERWSDDNPSVPFVNCSVGGSGIGSMTARLTATMANAPSHMTILIGANDLMSYDDEQDYCDTLFAYVAAAKAIVPTVRIGVCGVLPIDEDGSAASPPALYGFNTRAALANALLRDAVGNQIDWYIPLGEHPGLDPTDSLQSTDGIHWLSPGQVIQQQVYAASMDAVLAQSTAYSPTAFVFSDVTGATVSTAYSDSVVLSGLGMNHSATASITGSGTMARGRGAQSTSSFSVMNGDVITPEITASPSTGVELSSTITVGATSDVFSVSTDAGSVAQPSNIVAWWSPQDTSTMFETTSGGTAVVADGQVVGTLQDKSGNGHHLTAMANDSTRPVWHTTGGLKYITADGVNDALRRANVGDGTFPFQHCDGPFTIAVALKANPSAADKHLIYLRSGVGNLVCGPMSSNTTAANGKFSYRSDDGTSIPTGGAAATNRYTNLWDNTPRVVFLVVDGTNACFYKDDVAGTPWAVDDDSLDFSNATINLGLFAAFFNITPSGHFAADLYEMVIWDVALDSTERASELTRLAALQGRTL